MFRFRTAALTRRFADDVAGATAVEYALVAGGIAVAVAGVIYNLGADVKTNLWDKVAALF